MYSEIDHIQFSVWSSEDIKKYAVVEVKDSKLTGEGGVNDDRMGVVHNYHTCIHCQKDVNKCPGHFGYTQLNHMVCHPKYSSTIVDFLTCYCHNNECNKLLITSDEVMLARLNRFKKFKRFYAIVEYIKKKKFCNECYNLQPDYKYVDGKFFKYNTMKKKDKSNSNPQISSLEINNIIKNITSEDMKMFDLTMDNHPKNVIWDVNPIAPKSVRPSVETGNAISDDDLTTKYQEIIKFNNKLLQKTLKENERNELISKLEFHIQTLIDNTKGKSRPINGRPYKCVSERLNGKGGRFRTNLTGKRCDFTSRSVLRTDPLARANEVVIPKFSAERQTFPVIVYSRNFQELQELVNTGKANFVIRKENVTKEQRYDLKLHFRNKYTYKTQGFELQLGDTIIRDNKKIEFDKIKTQSSFKLTANDKVYRNNKLYKNLKLSETLDIDLDPSDVIIREYTIQLSKNQVRLIIDEEYYICDVILCKDYLLQKKKKLNGTYFPSFFSSDKKLYDIYSHAQNQVVINRIEYRVQLSDKIITNKRKCVSSNEKNEALTTEVYSDDCIIKTAKLKADSNYKWLYGDKLFRMVNGTLKEFKDFECKRNNTFEIKIGDIVERHLQDGDPLLLGRQPTLHIGSMIARKVRIIKEDAGLNNNKPSKCIGINLSLTKSMNADMDGDELNLYGPQSQVTRAELEFISSTEGIIKSTQSGALLQSLCQDALVSAYYFTSNTIILEPYEFFDVCMYLELEYDVIEHLEYIQKVLKWKGVGGGNVFNARNIFSLMLPRDFEYRCGDLVITRGVLLPQGSLTKASLGSGFSSIPHKLEKEYSADVCITFISNMQFAAFEMLRKHAFTVGVDDFTIDESKLEYVNNRVLKSYAEAQSIIITETNETVRELKINACLTNAVQVGERISVEAMSKNNPLNVMIISGAKGSYQNLSQITAIVGQQNVEGGRIPQTFGGRTLPFYPHNNENITPEDLYESRGMIKNSYMHGLTPQEFFFLAEGGREGVIDTAIKTARSGYIQRKLTKKMEDLKVSYSSFVLNANDEIVQPVYGDGFDPAKATMSLGKQSFVNPLTILDKINAEYEFNLACSDN